MSKLHAWAQHGHIQCMGNMHLLGELGHAPAINFFWNYTLWDCLILRWFLATNTILSVLFVCSLHIHMKVSAHANNNNNIFTQGTSEFVWAQAQVAIRQGVATPLLCRSHHIYHKVWRYVFPCVCRFIDGVPKSVYMETRGPQNRGSHIHMVYITNWPEQNGTE